MDRDERLYNLLHGVRWLLRDPSSWVQGISSEDADGRVKHPSSPSAVRWCLTGAITKVSTDMQCSHLRHDAKELLQECAQERPLEYWNDHTLRLHEHIIDVLEEGIQRLERAVK